jgi:hypothetical protein
LLLGRLVGWCGISSMQVAGHMKGQGNPAPTAVRDFRLRAGRVGGRKSARCATARGCGGRELTAGHEHDKKAGPFRGKSGTFPGLSGTFRYQTGTEPAHSDTEPAHSGQPDSPRSHGVARRATERTENAQALSAALAPLGRNQRKFTTEDTEIKGREGAKGGRQTRRKTEEKKS